QQLWSSILDSVSSSRAIPSKNVIILGEPSTGKTTLSNALLQRSNQRSRAEQQEGGGTSSVDFAIGYEWGNVKDEADEDILARLSVYTVPSSSPAHLALVPHFLPPKTSLSQTLVMIVLDWARPSTFLDQLRIWLEWVDRWAQGDGARELEVMREEGKERLQSHIQHYTEPAANSEAIPSTGANMLSSTLLPLSQGVFTHNRSGVPIVVVCAKADKIDDDAGGPSGMGGMGGLAKNKGAGWEERTDGIMQVLRTICLKYGAGLFYTSSSQPISLVQLRSYVLHLLFMPPPPAAPDQPPAKYLFPFRQRPNLLDRDRIAIPAGWDSWGKIGVVRDGFNCAKWEEAWERDVGEGGAPGGACDMYRAFVGMTDDDETPGLPPLVTTEPEQSFLSRQYEMLAKDPEDPRIKFREPQKLGEAGVVGPMGSSSFNMPTVVKAMTQMEGEDVAARLARMGGGAAANAQRNWDPRANTPILAPLTVPSLPNGGPPSSTAVRAVNKTGLGVATPGSNPTTPGGASATGGKSQHEVLQDFFQSLLQKGGGASTNTPASAVNPAIPVAVTAPDPPHNGITTDDDVVEDQEE
ncbi:hypothetical protein FRB97_000977, partial [Tulasnella sp. 331]